MWALIKKKQNYQWLSGAIENAASFVASQIIESFVILEHPCSYCWLSQLHLTPSSRCMLSKQHFDSSSAFSLLFSLLARPRYEPALVTPENISLLHGSVHCVAWGVPDFLLALSTVFTCFPKPHCLRAYSTKLATLGAVGRSLAHTKPYCAGLQRFLNVTVQKERGENLMYPRGCDLCKGIPVWMTVVPSREEMQDSLFANLNLSVPLRCFSWAVLLAGWQGSSIVILKSSGKISVLLQWQWI